MKWITVPFYKLKAWLLGGMKISIYLDSGQVITARFKKFEVKKGEITWENVYPGLAVNHIDSGRVVAITSRP